MKKLSLHADDCLGQSKKGSHRGNVAEDVRKVLITTSPSVAWSPDAQKMGLTGLSGMRDVRTVLITTSPSVAWSLDAQRMGLTGPSGMRKTCCGHEAQEGLEKLCR